MTNKQRAYQVGLLRQLHTAPRYTECFADEPIAYRAFLKKHLGVDSSKELSIDKLKELVAYFQMKSDTPPSNYASPQQIGYLKHLWKQRSRTKSEASLREFASRILSFEVEDIYQISPTEASKLIAAVKGIKPTPKSHSANNPEYKRGI